MTMIQVARKPTFLSASVTVNGANKLNMASSCMYGRSMCFTIDEWNTNPQFFMVIIVLYLHLVVVK